MKNRGQEMNGRIKYLDNVRALCMIWIVGVWHMSDYCGVTISNACTQNITYGVLGAFTFLSGMMMGGWKNRIRSAKDVFYFYEKRLIRMYPLFALSCTSLLLLHYLANVQMISGVTQYIFTMVGLSCVFTPAPGTIWYISMILLFYIITPFLVYKNDLNDKSVVLKSVLLYGLFILIKVTNIRFVDERLLILFPTYSMGLMINKEKIVESFKCNYIRFFLGLIAFCVMSVAEFKGVVILSGTVTKIAYTISVVILFIVFIMEAGKCFKGITEKILSRISYSSMCAYLFHRQIYGVISKMFGNFSVLIALISFISVIIISFYIQKIYDLLSKKIVV